MRRQAADFTVEELNKGLRSLQKQTRDTKYSSMMQLLRLALSGRQVKTILTLPAACSGADPSAPSDQGWHLPSGGEAPRLCLSPLSCSVGSVTVVHRHCQGLSSVCSVTPSRLQHGPSVAEMMVTLGAEEVCGRMHRALSS